MFLPVFGRFFFAAPVERPDDENINQQADRQQQEEEENEPTDTRHLGGLLRRGVGFLDQVGHNAAAAAVFDDVAIDHSCDGDDGD